MNTAAHRNQKGFSLLEVLVVLAIFTLITGVVFELLNVAQQRYKMESEFLDSFQTARLGIDQITRDVHAAGFPPIDTMPLAVACGAPQRVAYPFSWQPGYSDPSCAGAAPIYCTVGVNCGVPGAYDLIVETDVDPENGNGVEWIRYQLQGNTLMRGMASKTPGGNPTAATAPTMTPFIENVMNAATAAEMAAIQASYPTMFPGGVAVPIFNYTIPAGGFNTPDRIAEVNITLIVQAPNRDPRTNQLRVVTLTGLARRINPS